MQPSEIVRGRARGPVAPDGPSGGRVRSPVSGGGLVGDGRSDPRHRALQDGPRQVPLPRGWRRACRPPGPGPGRTGPARRDLDRHEHQGVEQVEAVADRPQVAQGVFRRMPSIGRPEWQATRPSSPAYAMSTARIESPGHGTARSVELAPVPVHPQGDDRDPDRDEHREPRDEPTRGGPAPTYLPARRAASRASQANPSHRPARIRSETPRDRAIVEPAIIARAIGNHALLPRASTPAARRDRTARPARGSTCGRNAG